MPVENLLIELRQLERPISDSARASMLAELRKHPTDIDGRRAIEWRRNIYFHSLQDLLLSKIEGYCSNPKQGELMADQACFVKDLDLYLAGFPEKETNMRELFGLVFSVGTSAYWRDDPGLVQDFYRVYRALDNEVINPWVMQE